MLASELDVLIALQESMAMRLNIELPLEQEFNPYVKQHVDANSLHGPDESVIDFNTSVDVDAKSRHSSDSVAIDLNTPKDVGRKFALSVLGSSIALNMQLHVKDNYNYIVLQSAPFRLPQDLRKKNRSTS